MAWFELYIAARVLLIVGQPALFVIYLDSEFEVLTGSKYDLFGGFRAEGLVALLEEVLD